MGLRTTLTERFESLPNTQYMTLLGLAIVLAAVAFEVAGMSIVAGLTLSLGLFFVLLGVLSHAIFWSIGAIESARL